MRNFVAISLVALAGLDFFPQQAKSQSVDMQFSGTLIDNCTIDSNSGGQLGFLGNSGQETGVSSTAAGGGAATLIISCNGGNRDLRINAVNKVSPTPASFSPTYRWARAVLQGQGNNKITTFENGTTTDDIKLAGNQTHNLTVDMVAHNPNAQLEAGTYKFNVVITVVSN